MKAKHYARPLDGTYAGLAPMYPPAYPQLLGKLAGLLQIEGAWMWKRGALVATLVVPALAYAAWTRLGGRRVAIVVTLVSVFALPVLHLHKTHEWLSVMLFVPWWLHYVAGAGSERSRNSGGTIWCCCWVRPS